MFSQDSIISPFFQYTLFFLILVLLGLSIYYLIYIGNRNVDSHRKINLNWKKIFKFTISIILFTFVLYLYKKFPIIGNATFSLFIAVAVAFILNPIVNKFEKLGINRSWGTIISYLIIVLSVVLLGIAIIPNLLKETTKLVNSLPSTVNNVFDSLNDLFVKYNLDNKILEDISVTANKYLISLASKLPEYLSSAFTYIQSRFGTLVTMVLIPLMSYYFIVDKKTILKRIYSLIPKNYRDDSKYLYHEINHSMGDFIRSRLLMAVFIGVVTGIMLSLFGIPFAWIIGIITMIFDVVPYIGPVVATVPALAFAFIKSPIIFLWVAILSMVLQWIEQNIVGTLLFSSSSGVHEIVILLSIIIGGGMFGVWGMILSVPVVILINIFRQYIYKKITNQPLVIKQPQKNKLNFKLFK